MFLKLHKASFKALKLNAGPTRAGQARSCSALSWREWSSGVAVMLATVALALSLGGPTELHRHVEDGVMITHDHQYLGAHSHSQDDPASVGHRHEPLGGTPNETPDEGRDSLFLEEPQLASELPDAALHLERPQNEAAAPRPSQRAEERLRLATLPARGPPAQRVC
ncbi:MAG: hypothetical protein AAF560_19225 [Acidobacteriota bacterium]